MPDSEQTQLYIATPAIWRPGMDDKEWEFELNRSVDRSIAAHAFLSGNLTPDEFEMALDEFGIDPLQAAEDWEQGKTYL